MKIKKNRKIIKKFSKKNKKKVIRINARANFLSYIPTNCVGK